MEYEKLLLKALSKIDELEETVSALSHRLEILETHCIGVEDSTHNSEHEIPVNQLQLSSAPEDEFETEEPADGDDDCTNNEIRQIIRDMVSKGLITEDVLAKFTGEKWCKNNFHLSYPLLRDVKYGRNDHLGYPRYWNEVITLNGNRYYMTHEWYTNRRKLFLKWYRNKFIHN